MPALRFSRWRAASVLLAVAASSCTVIYDYGDDPAAGGSGAGVGGLGGTSNVGGSAGCEDGCDDGSDCTTDDCVAGSCDHTPVADGTACDQAGNEGLCEGGTCIVACTAADPSVCDDDNECTVDSCDTDVGQCVNEPVADGPIAAQTEGDCQVVVCASGLLETQADDGDPFVDGEACTQDLCEGGVPSNPPVAAGTECGPNLVCDDGGICVGCNTAADCPGSNTFCQTITCSAQGQCGVSNTAAGTPLPAPDQTAGACKEIQCNGAGGTQTVNRANGTACDDGLYCNGSDSCLSGNCSQGGTNPCSGPDGDGDCSESCNESANDCSANDTNNSACNDGLFCTVNDTCSNGSCVGSGDPCASQVGDGDADCSESCNESANTCTANDPNGTMCNDGLFCTVTDTCSNGSCAGSGDPCAAQVGDGDADCSEACNESANNCTANDPAGASCTDGLYCNGSDTCNGGGSCSQHGGDPCMVFGGSCFSSCNETQNNCSAQDPFQTPCSGGCCTMSGSCGVCL